MKSSSSSSSPKAAKKTETKKKIEKTSSSRFCRISSSTRRQKRRRISARRCINEVDAKTQTFYELICRTTTVEKKKIEKNTRDALNPKPQNLHIFFSSRAKNRKAEPRARVQFHAHPKSLTHLACVLITRTLTLTQISSASSLLRKEEIERRGLVLF